MWSFLSRVLCWQPAFLRWHPALKRAIGERGSKLVVQCSVTVPSATREWREGTGSLSRTPLREGRMPSQKGRLPSRNPLFCTHGFREIKLQGNPKITPKHPNQELPRQTKPKKGPKRKVHMNFAHFFCEFWCFALGKQARLTSRTFVPECPCKKFMNWPFFGLFAGATPDINKCCRQTWMR